jgi:hypothetical protein
MEVRLGVTNCRSFAKSQRTGKKKKGTPGWEYGRGVHTELKQLRVADRLLDRKAIQAVDLREYTSKGA